MFYKCNCGTSVHLETKNLVNQPVNLMCYECFNKNAPDVYTVEYEIIPLRAIYHVNVFANCDKSAIETLKKVKNNPNLRIRKVVLQK